MRTRGITSRTRRGFISAQKYTSYLAVFSQILTPGSCGRVMRQENLDVVPYAEES